ncbi:DUF2306 domain-containing protein [Algoriphagus sp. SE2]|uniref:DUF2306 domain-containing protein n=1 Tax=Algoriphagus sp. SE2 TaxID=3141536 RepID=UPI0031CCDAA1
MKVTQQSPWVQPRFIFMLIAIAILTLLAGKFILHDALPYYSFDPEVFGRWKDFQFSLIGHISGGLIALLIGPIQFWESFRKSNYKIHRILGKIYLGAILLGTVSSTYLAWNTAIKININWALALQGLALAWFVTIAFAYLSILRKNIDLHREWMIKSYVVTFAFVSFRFMSDLQILQDLEINGETLIWVSWVIPLLITEMILSYKKLS